MVTKIQTKIYSNVQIYFLLFLYILSVTLVIFLLSHWFYYDYLMQTLIEIKVNNIHTLINNYKKWGYRSTVEGPMRWNYFMYLYLTVCAGSDADDLYFRQVNYLSNLATAYIDQTTQLFHFKRICSHISIPEYQSLLRIMSPEDLLQKLDEIEKIYESLTEKLFRYTHMYNHLKGLEKECLQFTGNKILDRGKMIPLPAGLPEPNVLM